MKQTFAKYTNFLLLGLAVIVSVSLLRNIFKAIESKKDTDKIKQNISKLQGENSELEARLKETQSAEFIEEQLRSKLGLSKKGEIVIVLPDSKILEEIAPKLPEEEEKLPDPTWKKWLKLFL